MSDPKKLIVVVDDEEDVALYLSAALEDEGFEVLVASNAKEGVSLVHSRRPDLICLDLIMPGRTGLSLYLELRKTPELDGVPIIVVSGVAREEAEGELGLGNTIPFPTAFIEKPVDILRLLAIVGELIGN